MTTMKNFEVLGNYDSHGDKYVLVHFELDGVSKKMIAKGYPTKMFGTLDKRFIEHDGTVKPQVTLISLAWGNTLADAIKHREERYEANEIIDKIKIF